MANITAALRKALQACSEENLAYIGEKWGLAGLNSEGEGTEDKERRMVDIISARFAWDALSLNARLILHEMIEHQVMDGVPRGDLWALTSLDEVEFVSALAELERSLMLIEIRPDAKVKQRLEAGGRQAKSVLAIPKDFHDTFVTIDEEIYDDYGDLSKLQLFEVLEALGQSKLQTIYASTATYERSYATSFYATSRNSAYSLAKTIAGQLVQANVVEFLWEQLDATEQRLCRWLCRADGNAVVSDAQSALDLSRPASAHLINHLENHGLVFDTFSGQEHRIFIGRGVFKVLRKLINDLDQQQAQMKKIAALPIELEQTPQIITDAQSRLLYDLAVVVNAAYQMVIEPTQAGNVPKRLANKIFPLLHGSRPNYYEDTDYYLDMVFGIAHTLELLQVQESLSQKSRYVPGPKLASWTYLEAFEQTQRLLEIWEQAANRSWSDVAGVNYRADDFGYGSYIEAQSSRRGLLAYIKEHCQPGRWYDLKPFLQTIKADHLLILRERSRYANYNGARNRKDVFAKWDHIDAEIITGMLASNLHDLGLVDLGQFQAPSSLAEIQEIKNPDAFRFTELAAQTIWDIHPETENGSDGRTRTLIVQPNFELLLLQPDYPTLYKLLPFTKANQIEMVSRLVLTQESVRRGVEAGQNVEQIITTLQAYSQKELPQNVLYTLQDWGRLYKNATVSQILLLEVGSEAIADEILASPKFRALELRRLGPCALAIEGQVSLQVLRTTLEKEGIILRVQGNILNAREFTSTSGYGRRR